MVRQLKRAEVMHGQLFLLLADGKFHFIRLGMNRTKYRELVGFDIVESKSFETLKEAESEYDKLKLLVQI